MAITITGTFKPNDPMGLYRDRPNPLGEAAAQPAAYDALQGNPANGFNTPLTDSEENAFEAWKAKYAPNDSGDDYDLRGAFKAGVTPDPQNGHFPDTFKKPNHPTFSNQSEYAKYAPDLAGTWDDAGNYIPSPAVARQRQIEQNSAADAAAHSQFDQLEQQTPGRYKLISAADYEKWQADWDKQNRSTNLLGDTVRLLDAGVAEVEQGVNELVGRIPGIGKPLQNLADAFDKLAYHSKSYDDRMQATIDKDIATLTPETGAAREAKWWDDKNNTLGPAWLNPRSYFAGVVESLPSTVLTMAPAMGLARGAYLGALASGASKELAAAAAAKSALLAGAVTEGGFGGAQSAQTVRQQIAQIPRDKLLETQSVQTLIKQGMSPDAAISAVTEDAATQAFIMGGVATGVFGGFGDRFLAKIIAEGVGGSLAKRIVSGATRGIVAEGLLEEAPQNAGQQIGQNLALKNTVNPDQDPFEGVAEQTLSGAAIGAAMGGVMGGAGGAVRPAEAAAEPSAEPAPYTSEPFQPKSGPLATAVRHGLEQSPLTPATAISATLPADEGPVDVGDAEPGFSPTRVVEGRTVPLQPVDEGNLPKPGSNVVVEAEGLDQFTGQVQGYEQGEDGLEAMVADPTTGEVLQVPIGAIKTARLTDELIAKMDREANPPIERPPVETPASTSRQVRGETMVLPDEKHAQLYDLGQQRKVDKGYVRVLGDDALKSNDQHGEVRQRIADAFEIPVERVNELADDYRYRVENSAKGGLGTGLPLNMHAVSDKLLQRFQIERLKAEKKAAANSPEIPDSSTPDANVNVGTIDAAGTEAATHPHNPLPEPTQPQKEAGNYKMGHFVTGGLDISIENPAGSTRSGVDKGGKPWSVEMKSHYGYIKGTVGKDKDHIDVFVKKGTGEIADDAPVFVVDQHNAEGGFDEHKVMLGYKTAGQARNAYLANYTKGWKGLGAISPTTLGDFKDWLKSGNTAKPFAQAKEAYTDQPEPTALQHAIAEEDALAAARKAEKFDDQPEPTALQHARNEESAQRVPDNLAPLPAALVNLVQASGEDAYEALADLASDERTENKQIMAAWNDTLGQRVTGASHNGHMMTARKGQLEVLGPGEDGNPKRQTIRGKDLVNLIREAFGPGADEGPRKAAPDVLPNPDATVPSPKRPIDAKIFPPAKKTVSYANMKLPVISPDEAAAKLEEWKARAKEIGKTEDHSKEGVLSLFDASGAWSQPFVDAGYTVLRFDAAHGDDIFYDSPTWVIEEMKKRGVERIVGVLAATPCTTFASSGARWWDGRHNVSDSAMVEKLFGYKAAQLFDTPVDANRWMVHATELYVELADPVFHVMENPIGRLPEMAGLGDPQVRFNPNNFGDPYTKQTQLWGTFNTDLPTANVEPTEGSKIQSKLRGDNPEDKAERSKTPEGFAYSFFMAQYEMLAKELGYHSDDEAIEQRLTAEGPWDFNDTYPTPDLEQVRRLDRDGRDTYEHDAAGNFDVEAVASSLDEALQELEIRRLDYLQARHDINEITAGRKTVKGGGTDKELKRLAQSWKEDEQAIEDLLAAHRDVFTEDAVKALRKEAFARADQRWKQMDKGAQVRIPKGQRAKETPAAAKTPRIAPFPIPDDPHPILARKNALVDWVNALSDEDYAALEKSFGYDTPALNANAIRSDIGMALEPEKTRTLWAGDIEQNKQASSPKAEVAPTPKADTFAKNKLFTADKVEAARARLRSKMGQLNSGIDPEVLIDGMTIAGAYIEAGVRNFADYARQMTADFGDGIKPYLLSFWEGARNYPGLDTEGMTPAAESAAQHKALVGPAPASEAIGEIVAPPAKRTKRSGRVEDRTLTQDWGVEHIDGYGTDPSREEGNDTKDAFIKDAVAYLRAVASVLEDRGFAPQEDRRGKAMKAVSKNESGVAGSGDITLTMRHPDTGANVYAHVSGTSLRGVVPTTPSGISVMYRVSVKDGDTYGVAGGNRWLKTDLSAGEFADILERDAKRAAATKEVQGEPSKLDQSGPGSLEGAPAAEVRQPQEGGDAGRGTEPGGRADLFGSDGARGQRDASGRGLAGGAGEVSAAAGRAVSELAADSAATPAQNRADDFTITEADEIGQGGAKTKFRNNVAAIQLLRELEANDRPATRDEQAVLAKWVGWGGLAAAFYREDGTTPKGWEREAAELKELLSPEEYRAAAASTRNAHYTSPEVVGALWKIVERLGFTGGLMLEPSVGAGNFIGLMPPALRDNAQIHGAELDPITGGIAKNLYPKANIQITGFQDLTIPNDYFDLAIGNPPFGSEKLYDAERRELNKFSIHNYFIAKSIETLKPGGVLAMVVTNYFLDARDVNARHYISERADLVAAIRLPNDAFLKNAGTEVTTDLVIFHKRKPGTKAKDARWVSSALWRDEEGREVFLNPYFQNNPDMMLGKFGGYGTMYGRGEAALISRPGQDLAADLEQAISTLPRALIAPAGAVVAPVEEIAPTNVFDALVNSMFLAPDGTVMQRQADEIGQARAVKVDLPNEKAVERVAGMIRVRDAFTRLRQAQVDPKSSDEKLANLRERLNKAYDGFVAKHGFIHNEGNRRLFRDDPTWPQIAALEDNYDKGISDTVAARTGEKPRAPSAKKAAIFSKRTQSPYSPPTSASSAKDALAAVLSDRGTVDLAEMSRLYGKPQDQIIRELAGLIYRTPKGTYETADQYLSGNVKTKLQIALEAAEKDPTFQPNVEALRAVIPADIEAIDIDVKAGAPWVPGHHVANFIERIADAPGARATYASGAARWSLKVPRPGPAAEAQWGTRRASLESVVEAALNASTITIYDRVDANTTAVNREETDAANDKVEKVKAEWRRWIWEDDARRIELARLYNDIFNTDVLRTYDGSHLQLPGKVSDDIISLRPHQKNYIWRGLQTGTILADHTVGAGKTFANIALIMEKRRMGQVRKPIVVVPNHLVGQWAADWLKLYPSANILAATKADFEGPNRRKLFARIATGDWDSVIVAHSSFKYLPVDPQFEKRFIEQQIADMQVSIAELRAADGEKSRTVKQMEKAREALSTKLQKLLDAGGKDELGMTFEDMGIDGLFVDEAHEFKNLGFATRMQRVAGLGNTTGSQKAADLFVKVTSVLERTGGRNVGFMTGTPISNTMAEMFTMQRYLDYRTLRDLGIAHFDSWARVFGEVVTDWELSPSGKYKQNSRFAKFVNMPELMQRYLSFADVITNDDIQRQLAEIGQKLPIPKIRGGKPTNLTVERSPDQATYIGVPRIQGDQEFYPEGSLVYRAEHLPKKAEKGADNMLKVMSDARKAALDMRLIDPAYPDYGGSKVHRAAAEIFRLHRAWAAQRGTQLVFIDLSTPKSAKSKEEAELRELMAKAEDGDQQAQEKLDSMSPDEFLALNSSFSVYDDLRDKLIALGIDPKEIAFIHDANTDAQKQELFGKVRSGQVRILFGSTPKMGAGTNVQNRLVALHHLDAPWRPSDLEQRDGRGVRQGNELYAADPDNFEIEILRYATKNTLDARQWQTIEGKARFIAQLRKGNIKERVVEDVAGEAANAAEMKAAASGNPLILEEIDLKQKIRRLEGAESEHDRAQHRIRFDLHRLRSINDDIRGRLDAMKGDAEKAMAFAGAPLKAEIAGATVEKPKELGTAIIAAGRAMVKDGASTVALGDLGGFALSLHHEKVAAKSIGELEITHSFDLTIKGGQEYGVDIADIDSADATGTAMRVLNVIRDLAHAPANAETRITENERQIAGLEKQVGPWDGVEELDKLKERHREVLTALKPKQTPAQPAAAPHPPAEETEYSEAETPAPVVLTGDELGVKDMAGLRKAAVKWYEDNLVGEAAHTRDGITVLFNRAGAKEIASGVKTEALLKVIPALKAIVENGRVIRREPVTRALPQGDASPEARGTRLASVREALGKTQAAMAAELGLSPQRYGTYERLREPPADVLFKIRQLTGATADYILFGHVGSLPVDLAERMKATMPPEVKERIVIAAPVSIGGQVRTYALTVHGTPDGKFAYDLAPTPETGSGEFSADAGEAVGVNLFEIPPGWGEAEGGAQQSSLTDAQRQELTDIVQKVSGLSEVDFRGAITMPANNAGWGNDAPRSAGGFYDPVSDLIALADTAGPRQAYHEAFHRLQRLFLTDAERKILATETGKLRRIVGGNEFRRDQVGRMSQKELEAEAFAIYAAGGGDVKPYKAIRAAWDRIKLAAQRVSNYLRGLGFQTSEDIFSRAAAGDTAARTQPNATERNGTREFEASAEAMSAAFRRWFAKSKVVDAAGQPLVVYHGTAAVRRDRDGNHQPDQPINFDTFSTKNEMAAHFGTIEQAQARVGEASEDNPIRFYPVYLSIQNPLRVRDVGEFSFDTLAGDLGDRGIIDDASEWLDRYEEVAEAVNEGRYEALERINEEFKDHLKSLGYDGLVYLNRGESNVDPDDPDISSLSDKEFKRKVPTASDSWVAFDASQIKSAIANRGTYSPTDPRIQYSMAESAPGKMVARVGDEAAGRWLDVQPKLLAAVPLTYFAELARPKMSAVAAYLRVKRDMDAYRGTRHAAADVIAQKWLKYTRLGFGLLPSKDGKAAAEKLASLMHDATLAGVDPSKTEAPDTLHPAYPALRARYTALPPSGQSLFKEVRNAYTDQAAELDKLILQSIEKAQKIAVKKAEEAYEDELERIKKSGLKEPELKKAIDEANERYAKARIRSTYANKARITALRKAFEASRVPAPYFPLARFGRYFVTVRDRAGNVVSFSRRETAKERNELARDMRAAFGADLVESGVMDEAGAGLREAMDPRIVAEIEGILSQGGVDPSIMDAIWQRYLQSLPDLSTRKRFIHRKGTAGFDADALRAFSSHMFHAGHQMARIKYGVDLQEMLDQAAIQARKSDDPTRGTTLVNELAKRHKWVMNPTGSAAVQAVTSAMFVWYLGLTPAAAMVNLTQTPMLGIPIIGAKYGMAKTAAALVKASGDFIAGKGNAADAAALTDEERQALEKFHESGLIDRTRSHDLAGVGNTGVDYSPLRAKVMSIVSWAFHKAEIANREVTALAAYRLARAAGESVPAALDSAHDLTWKVHFDYSNSSRPRLLQSDAAKLLLVFQNYQINMWYRLFRDIHQSFKADTPQARKEARYQVAGIMGMMTLLGGVTGFFGFHALMALAGMFFGDKDDPYDFEDQMKRHVIDMFGPDVGGMILNGVPGKLLNIDLTSRIGMPDFFVRAPDQPNLEGRDWWKEFIVGALGVVPNTIMNWGDGLSTIASGNTMKGLELMAPKAIRDVMQAYRFANEGLTTRNGDQILPADTLGAWQTISKVLGFTPASVSEAYDRNNALKTAEARISDERSILLNQLALAIENGDEDTRALVLERIKAFNAVPIHRAVAITPETIRRSLVARRRNSAKREDGVLIQNPGLSKALRALQPERMSG